MLLREKNVLMVFWGDFLQKHGHVGTFAAWSTHLTTWTWWLHGRLVLVLGPCLDLKFEKQNLHSKCPVIL
jgi:hypothetical protein